MTRAIPTTCALRSLPPPATGCCSCSTMSRIGSTCSRRICAPNARAATAAGWTPRRPHKPSRNPPLRVSAFGIRHRHDRPRGRPRLAHLRAGLHRQRHRRGCVMADACTGTLSRKHRHEHRRKRPGKKLRLGSALELMGHRQRIGKTAEEEVAGGIISDRRSGEWRRRVCHGVLRRILDLCDGADFGRRGQGHFAKSDPALLVPRITVRRPDRIFRRRR